MAFIFSSDPTVKRPEAGEKIIKGKDFWSYRLAAEIIHDAFLREKSIIHAAESAYLQQEVRGYKDGTQKAQAQFAECMMDTVNRTVLYLMKTESQFAALVYDSVRQVIAAYDDNQKALAVVKSAIAAMRGQKHIILKLNPCNMDYVTSELRSLHAAFPTITHIEIVEQADISADACIVHTEIGSAEASIGSQLDALKSSLNRVFGSLEISVVETASSKDSTDSEYGEHSMSLQDEES